MIFPFSLVLIVVNELLLPKTCCASGGVKIGSQLKVSHQAWAKKINKITSSCRLRGSSVASVPKKIIRRDWTNSAAPQRREFGVPRRRIGTRGNWLTWSVFLFLRIVITFPEKLLMITGALSEVDRGRSLGMKAWVEGVGGRKWKFEISSTQRDSMKAHHHHHHPSHLLGVEKNQISFFLLSNFQRL